jgi:calcineurin-like phosphoesterase family protein
MRFFTSDWHLGHLNVIHFDQRPFHSLKEMRDTLVRNYNAIVSPWDTCYFLGDMIWSKTEDAEAIKELHGHKVLIPGNHDHKRSFELFDEVIMGSLDIEIAGERVSMSHCPVRGIFREETFEESEPNWHGEKKYGRRFSIENKGQFHAHGHIHSDQFGRKLGRQFDVGCRANLYFPVSEEEISAWIADTLYKESLK